MKILIAGYPYIKESYFKTFSFYPEKNEVFFLLPTVWKAKGGKLKFYPPREDNVYMASAYFFHSNYPIIGGLLKGWMPSFPLALFKIRKRIDIVYSPSEPILLTMLYQGLWAKILGKKHVIFTWENIPYEEKFRGINLLIKKSVLRLNLLFCDGLICGNRKSLDIHRQLTRKPIAEIPLSGVDEVFFQKTGSPKIFKSMNLENKVVFSFAGAIGRRKGVHLILEALAAVVKKIPNAYLIIAGSGEYEESLKLKVESLKLQELVTFVPWLNRDELRELLSVSDVFLYPSISYGGWEEQFGYSIAEASLMELPIISTRSGSIEGLVVDGKTGILVESNNINPLKEAMIKLAEDPGLRMAFGREGRQFVVNNYSYEVVARKFYDFLSSLIIKNPNS